MDKDNSATHMPAKQPALPKGRSREKRQTRLFLQTEEGEIECIK